MIFLSVDILRVTIFHLELFSGNDFPSTDIFLQIY